MQDLLGRLTALDPEASETLKVVSYFDTLVARSAGVESMLRGAALLCGTSVAYRDGTRLIRVGEGGDRIAPQAGDDDAPHRLRREVGTDAVVWLEREGAPHANDMMVLERLALALGIVRARRSTGADSAVEIAIDAGSSAEERISALARLRITPSEEVRVVASSPAPAPLPRYPSAVIATPHGPVRAMILRPGSRVHDAWPVPGSDAPVPRTGVGVRVPSVRVPESWTAALVAVRLTTQSERMVDAADLGAFLLLAEVAESQDPHPDALALATLDVHTRTLLDTVAGERSVRAAAIRLGMHHSSVQERLSSLETTLGYDPRSPRGRIRYTLARMLLALSDSTFAD